MVGVRIGGITVHAPSSFTRGPSETGREEPQVFIPTVGPKQVWVSELSAGCLPPVIHFYQLSLTKRLHAHPDSSVLLAGDQALTPLSAWEMLQTQTVAAYL